MCQQPPAKNHTKNTPIVEHVGFITLAEKEHLGKHEVSQLEGVSLTETLHDYKFNYRIKVLVWWFGEGSKKMGICFRLDMAREWGHFCDRVGQ